MVAVPLGVGSYRRRGARTPEIALVNMLVEKDPTNLVDGIVRFQRPALKRFTTLGTSASRGIFRKLGVLSSNYYPVSGQKLYSVTASGAASVAGTITGNDIVSMDGSADRLIVVAEGTAYSYDGSALTTIVVPDINSVPSFISSVTYIAGYFILTVKDSQHFFWLAPGDVNPDALNFASAEAAPDNIVASKRLGDEVLFFGQECTEFWQLSGTVDAPFIPIVGRLYNVGCANRDTIADGDNGIFWVGNDFFVYRVDTAPQRISDHSVEERLRVSGSDGMRAWSFVFDGHTIYVLRASDTITAAYDVENKNWSRFKTYDQETWRAHLGVQVAGDLVIAGDDTDGTLWQLDSDLSNDDGVVLEREITGGIAIVGKPQKCKDFTLTTAVGWAAITGTATDPKVQMRFSDNQGATWSAWFEQQLGLQGKYRTQVVWQQLGAMYAPGRIFHLRCTDDTIFRLSYARLNESVAAA